MSDEVRYERHGPAAVLTIDRPHRRNAVDAKTAAGLRRGLEEFEADAGARALVLTGAGGEAFCAGADLKALDLDVDDPAGPMGFTRLTPSKPAIAAIDGIAAADPAAVERAHGVFGAMALRDWQRWAYKHVDHHLRQFGV